MVKKTEFVAVITKKTELCKRDAEKVVKSFMNVVKSTVPDAGNRIKRKA